MANQADAGFDPSGLFSLLNMRRVDGARFDAEVVDAPGRQLRCVFFWGPNCYNCDRFKAAALALHSQLEALDLSWFQADVYQDEALGRRFALHGVPAFVFYCAGKRLGRISGWPGLPSFSEAVARLRAAPS